VLVTDWTEPEGIDPPYRQQALNRCFGASASAMNEPCAEDFVGIPPFRQQLGLIPYFLSLKTRGLEGADDAIGSYRRSSDGLHGVSIYDPRVTLSVKDVPDLPGMITPAKDMKNP